MRSEYTLLHTDVVDSTAVNTRLGDVEMTTLWNRHDRLSRDLLRTWRGREIDRSDGFMVLFDSAADGAGFAAAYHRMLAGLPVPLKARAGLHVGPLTLRENTPDDVALGAKPLEVVGIAKAVSARLMTLAQGGQTLASASAQAALAADPACPWRRVSHGHWRMKGLDEVLEVFEIGDDQAAFMPPPDAEKSRRVVQVRGEWVGLGEVAHNLPAERDSFVGRSSELQALAAQFSGGARVVTVAGIGGMGKTRLALRYAWAWLGDHPGGVWFCDLSAARELDGVLYAVAQSLDVPLGNDPVAQLGRAIAGRGACLVILDNFEQVKRHTLDTLGRWLDAAPAARFLVTSRELLGLDGEHALALEPLPHADATALFHQRAREAHAAHDAQTIDPAVMRELVDLLDGLPLGLELAAPRVRVLPPHELLKRMSDRFRLLSAGAGRPGRQATLRATLQWSWELLSPAERSALAQLAVFAGGFTWAAAEQVLDLSACDDVPWVVDLVQSLVDKSLVRGLPGQRFSMLRSVQEFAADQLQTPGTFPASGATFAHALRLRHRRYFAQLDEAAISDGNFAELDNLVAACHQAIADQDPGDAFACLTLSYAVLRMTGPFRTAAELAAAVGALPGAPPAVAAGACAVEGYALHACGDIEGARAAVQRGLQTAPPDLPHELDRLLGEVHMLAGEFDAADACFRRALACADRHANPISRCAALNSLGASAQYQGRLAEARDHYQTGLAIAQVAKHRRWQASLLGNLAGLHYAQGRLDEAREAYEHSLALARQINSRRQEGHARCNIGLILHELGHSAEAESELLQALQTARSMGHVRLVHTVLCNLGLVVEARGDPAGAAAQFEAAMDAAHAIHDRRSEAQYCAYLAQAQGRLRRIDAAWQAVERGRQLAAQSRDPLTDGLLACAAADVEQARGDVAAAHAALASGRAILAEQAWDARSELGRRIAFTTARWAATPA